MGLKGYRLWAMGKLDSTCRAPPRGLVLLLGRRQQLPRRRRGGLSLRAVVRTVVRAVVRTVTWTYWLSSAGVLTEPCRRHVLLGRLERGVQAVLHLPRRHGRAAGPAARAAALAERDGRRRRHLQQRRLRRLVVGVA
jgi:hypothetical protein